MDNKSGKVIRKILEKDYETCREYDRKIKNINDGYESGFKDACQIILALIKGKIEVDEILIPNKLNIDKLILKEIIKLVDEVHEKSFQDGYADGYREAFKNKEKKDE